MNLNIGPDAAPDWRDPAEQPDDPRDLDPREDPREYGPDDAGEEAHAAQHEPEHPPRVLCSAVHPDDANLPDPIPEEWHTYRRVCALPADHPTPTDGLGRHLSPQGDRWNDAPPPAVNLPAPFGSPLGGLDVDTLRALAPQVRAGLIDALRQSATALRANRGTVVVPEDTFDLVRRLTAGEEVLRQWAQAFTRAADEAVAIAEEEALTALGSYPGIEEAPSGSLFVPDGERQRIAVTPQWKSGESEWDLPSLIGWLAEDEARDYVTTLDHAEDRDPEERTALVDGYVEFGRALVDRLLGLGRFTPGAKALDDLRKRLAGQQRDTDAAVIRQVRSVGPRKYQGVKITREDVK